MVEDLTLSIKEEIDFANDLKNNINNFDFISSLRNLLTNNLKQCKTYETNCKLPLTKKKKNLFILHINIRSIYKNFDTLNHEFLQTLDYLPDIICLSETKIKNLLTVNHSLTSYHSIEHANSQTAAGGVGIYISDNYSSKTIEKNTLNCNCEDIWIQISNFNSNQIFYLGVIY